MILIVICEELFLSVIGGSASHLSGLLMPVCPKILERWQDPRMIFCLSVSTVRVVSTHEGGGDT